MTTGERLFKFAAVMEAIRSLGGKVRPFGRGVEIGFQFSGRNLDDKGLAKVGALERQVILLNLRDTQITDAGMPHLAKLTQLQRLHLERTAVTDAGLAYLSELKELTYLNLYGTKISDQGLRHLINLRKLENVYLWETDVTDAGCAALQKSLPGLRIDRGVDLEVIAARVSAEKKEAAAVKRVELQWVPAGGVEPPNSKTGDFTSVSIYNQRKRSVKLFWIEYGGGRRFYAEISAGETLLRNTYSEATWLITTMGEVPLGHFIATVEPSQITIPE